MPPSASINPASIAGERPELRLLGVAALLRDGRALTGPAAQRHPLALLALLALAPLRTLTRDKLVGYLWPESGDRVARNRLTTLVHNVRRAAGEGVIVTAGSDLRLDGQALACDVLRFEAARAAGLHAEVAAHYAGPLLDGFHLPDSPAFDDWLFRERERLRLAWRDSVEHLARDAARRHDRAGTVRWWRRLVDDDPLDSRTTRLLMAALDDVGNPAEAIRMADRHARLLREELGAEPSAEFTTLADRLTSRRPPTATDGATRRVAVLPFEPVGAEPMPGFTDGVHGDLMNRLSRLADLAVISRSSVARYRGDRREVAAIGRELGAAWIVEGEVRATEREVRVDVRLVQAGGDRQVWGETYRSALTASELFDVQAHIATRIASALETHLTPGERRAVAHRQTSALESHVLYVQGRGQVDERTEAALAKAVECFQGAIGRDPGFALAWSGLADAIGMMQFYAYALPEGAPDPMEAARRALALDPSSGEAHASVGIIHSLRGEGALARRALERATVLQPSHAEAHMWLAWVLLLAGRAGDALEPARRAMEIDPLAPAYRVYGAEIWLANGDAARALAEATRGAEIQPSYGLAHFMRALVLLHLGEPGAARAALDAAEARVPPLGTPSHAEVHALRAVSHVLDEDRAAACAALERIQAMPDETADAFSEALALAAVGEIDAAFGILEHMERWEAFAVEYLRYFFPDVLAPLRRDARFAGVLQRLDQNWGAAPDS